MRKRKKRTSSGSGRSYAAEAVKAASHPTRQVILKSLQKNDCSTTELEEATGENRYNLYHHLAVLQNAGLIEFRYRDNKAKEYFLKKPARPDTVFVQLERRDPEDAKKLDRILSAVADEIPHLPKVSRARLMLTYPWSSDEED